MGAIPVAVLAQNLCKCGWHLWHYLAPLTTPPQATAAHVTQRQNRPLCHHGIPHGIRVVLRLPDDDDPQPEP